MTTIAVLVGAILAATGPLEFPARINTTADALAAQAETRFNQSSDLLTFCSTLYENTQTGTYVATWAGMTDEDVEVFSFFLTVNTALDGELRWVRPRTLRILRARDHPAPSPPPPG